MIYIGANRSIAKTKGGPLGMLEACVKFKFNSIQFVPKYLKDINAKHKIKDLDKMSKIIKDNDIKCIKGNHEYGLISPYIYTNFNFQALEGLDYTRNNITEENLSFLQKLEHVPPTATQKSSL